MALIADSKEMCLFWRTGKNGIKAAYFRKRIGGKDKWQSLGELAPDDARRLVQRMRRDAALGDIEQRLGYASLTRRAHTTRSKTLSTGSQKDSRARSPSASTMACGR